MKSSDIEYELSQLLDGDLPEERAEVLRRRLADEPALAEANSLYQSLDSALTGLAEEIPSVDWQLQRESIRAILERESLLKPPASMWRGRLFRWSAAVTAAAAAVVALILGVQWFISAGPPVPPRELVVDWRRPSAAWSGRDLSSELLTPTSAAPLRGLTVEFDRSGGDYLATVGTDGPRGPVSAGRAGTIVVSAAGPLRAPDESLVWELEGL